MTRPFKRFRTQPLQTVLLIVQVMLGSFAMTLALSAYLTPENANNSDTFYLDAGSRDANGTGMNYNVFLPEDFPELLTLTADVADIAIFNALSGSEVTYKGERFKFLSGNDVTPNYFELAGVEVTQGTAFGSAEEAKQDPVVLISEGAAKTLFGDLDPIGQEIRAASTTYRVLGVFKDVTGPTRYGQPGIYFPTWAPMQTFADGEGFTTLLAQAKPGRRAEAEDQLLAAVRQVYRDHTIVQEAQPGRDFFVSTSESVLGNSPGVNSVFIILGLFGIIALMISSIGMFSNTFVDVTGRTHAIGINRALGATSRDVGRAFSLEAALLSLIGSVLGAALTWALMPVLTKPLEQSYLYGSRRLLWQPESALIVIFVAVVLGAALASVPALRAGRMKPIEALKGA